MVIALVCQRESCAIYPTNDQIVGITLSFFEGDQEDRDQEGRHTTQRPLFYFVRKGVVRIQGHPMLGGERLHPIRGLYCHFSPHKLPYLVVAEKGGVLEILRPPFVHGRNNVSFMSVRLLEISTVCPRAVLLSALVSLWAE